MYACSTASEPHIYTTLHLCVCLSVCVMRYGLPLRRVTWVMRPGRRAGNEGPAGGTRTRNRTPPNVYVCGGWRCWVWNKMEYVCWWGWINILEVVSERVWGGSLRDGSGVVMVGCVGEIFFYMLKGCFLMGLRFWCVGEKNCFCWVS